MCWTAIPARDAAVAERVAKRDQHLLVGSVAVVPHDSKIGPRDAEAVDGVGFRSVQPVGDRCGRGRGRWNWGSGSRTLGCCIWTPVGRVRAWLVICARRIGPGYYRGLILLRRGARRTGSRRVGRSGRQPTRRGGGAWFGASAGLRPVGTCSTGTLARGGPRCRCGVRCSGRNRLRARVGGGGRGRDHQHDESDGGARRSRHRCESRQCRHDTLFQSSRFGQDVGGRRPQSGDLTIVTCVNAVTVVCRLICTRDRVAITQGGDRAPDHPPVNVRQHRRIR
jgi:hypothetical protein